MVEYIALVQQKNDFLQIFRTVLSEAKDNYAHEAASALNIQRVFRGIRGRTALAKKHYAVTEIQRAFRGSLGRTKAKNELKNKLDNKQLSIFQYLIIQIQKSFRGYYSRKYKQSHARRKKYRQKIESKGEEIRNKLSNYSAEQLEHNEFEAKNKKDNEFKSFAENLHHLVSTKHIAGVYKPSEEFLDTPTMNQMPVEEHIRGFVKDLLRTRGIAKTGLVTDLNGTKKIPLNGLNLKYRLSLQASAPYDTLKNAERANNALHKILTASKGNFVAGGKTELINKSFTPLSIGNVYMDPWANPMLVKGVPKDTKQLLESARVQKPLFVTPLEKPFYTKASGNKSTTLPNDVFDVIASAEETGGAAQRHRGVYTTRFGLSANTDNRTDGHLPAAPLRASSTLKSTRRVNPVVVNLASKTLGNNYSNQMIYNKKTLVVDENEYTLHDDQTLSIDDSTIVMQQQVQTSIRNMILDSDSDNDL